MALPSGLGRNASSRLKQSPKSVSRVGFNSLRRTTLQSGTYFKASGRVVHTGHHDRGMTDFSRQREAIIAPLRPKNSDESQISSKEDQDTILAARPPPGHKYWGFTIFRCTYGDDEAWARLMKFLEEDAREAAESYGVPRLMDSLNLKVHQDPSGLEGASKTLVRRKFEGWLRSSDVEHERDGPDGQPILMQGIGTTSRYGYCIHVDEASLYSIIDCESKQPKDEAELEGYVNVVQAGWISEAEALAREAAETGEGDEDLGEADDQYEAIEGCEEYDVGWVKANVHGLMPGSYARLHGNVLWEFNYRRPPEIAETL